MTSNSTRRAVAKAAKGGKSPIAGMGVIVAKARSKAQATRNGPKIPETDHLQGKQFSGGKHRASTSAASAKKNAYGTDYIGKHRSGNSSDRGPIVHV
jgi:hypothetical protein